MGMNSSCSMRSRSSGKELSKARTPLLMAHRKRFMHVRLRVMRSRMGRKWKMRVMSSFGTGKDGCG